MYCRFCGLPIDEFNKSAAIINYVKRTWRIRKCGSLFKFCVAGSFIGWKMIYMCQNICNVNALDCTRQKSGWGWFNKAIEIERKSYSGWDCLVGGSQFVMFSINIGWYWSRLCLIMYRIKEVLLEGKYLRNT